MEFYRTGQTSKHRVCPKHRVELELCINDTDYSKWSHDFLPISGNQDNRVAWRCDQCIGYWFENHFIDQLEWERPYRIEVAQLVLCCPNCNSRRVTHTCEPECCQSHRCLDCDSEFESRVEVIGEGDNAKNERPRVRGQGWTSSGRYEPGHMHRTGVMRNYRKCIHEDHGQLELVLIDPIRRCDAQTGWYCEQCNRVDYEVGGQRSVRLNFHAEALPLALCPKCNSSYLDSTESAPGHCRCIECDVEIKISLVPKADPTD